jgi:O-antigen/teichoic acid export membrane protein
MDPPYGAILFLAILSIFAAILSIRQARRKGKIHYIGAVVGCLMLSVFALALLGQALLAFILLVVGGIACIAALPRVMAVQKREMDKQLTKAIKETDPSEPLRLKDFLRWKGWLKLAHRWGALKTAGIYSILGAIILAGITYTALRAFNMMNVWLVAGYTATATIVIFILFYRQISKTLEKPDKSV